MANKLAYNMLLKLVAVAKLSGRPTGQFLTNNR